VQIEKPRQNASCVRFDNWHRLIERKAGNGVRSVFADARELLQLINATRKLPAMSIHNRFCCGVEIARAFVIAETLPTAKHIIFRSAGQ
jgi:hypothetical protein